MDDEKHETFTVLVPQIGFAFLFDLVWGTKEKKKYKIGFFFFFWTVVALRLCISV